MGCTLGRPAKENKMKKEDLSFEELVTKLEDVTNKLEKDNLNLDESIKLFEEGMEISKKCNKRLEEAEKKITILLQDGEEVKEENFNVD